MISPSPSMSVRESRSLGSLCLIFRGNEKSNGQARPLTIRIYTQNFEATHIEHLFQAQYEHTPWKSKGNHEFLHCSCFLVFDNQAESGFFFIFQNSIQLFLKRVPILSVSFLCDYGTLKTVRRRVTVVLLHL